MFSQKTRGQICIALGLASLIALGVAHLALTGIAHGESDLTLEWTVLRGAALTILAFHISALTTVWRTLS